jgi:hypothetical protein
LMLYSEPCAAGGAQQGQQHGAAANVCCCAANMLPGASVTRVQVGNQLLYKKMIVSLCELCCRRLKSAKLPSGTKRRTLRCCGTSQAKSDINNDQLVESVSVHHIQTRALALQALALRLRTTLELQTKHAHSRLIRLYNCFESCCTLPYCQSTPLRAVGVGSKDAVRAHKCWPCGQAGQHLRVEQISARLQLPSQCRNCAGHMWLKLAEQQITGKPWP